MITQVCFSCPNFQEKTCSSIWVFILNSRFLATRNRPQKKENAELTGANPRRVFCWRLQSAARRRWGRSPWWWLRLQAPPQRQWTPLLPWYWIQRRQKCYRFHGDVTDFSDFLQANRAEIMVSIDSDWPVCLKTWGKWGQKWTEKRNHNLQWIFRKWLDGMWRFFLDEADREEQSLSCVEQFAHWTGWSGKTLVTLHWK